MTSSTKWMVAIFAVVATFAAGMFLPGNVVSELNPRNILASFDGIPGGVSVGTANSGQLELSGADQGAAGVPKPLPQVGGNNLLLNPGGGNVGIGTFTPTEQFEITGNFRLPLSTATAGIIMSGADRYIHNFGKNNFFAGVNAGNLSMTGVQNTATGAQALVSNTTGNSNTATGIQALFSNTTGLLNTATGAFALGSTTTGLSNTATGNSALPGNTTGSENTADGGFALQGNDTGSNNTAIGFGTLLSNLTGSNNTALGHRAGVSQVDLTNATAIGSGATVDASNKIRLDNTSVTVIEAQVGLTVVSDVNQKENFQPVDGEETLEKLRALKLESWNYRGHDPIQFRHYGPTAQEFFAAFGDDGFGTIGTETTINSGDMAGIMMIAIQALETRNAALQQRLDDLEARIAAIEE